MEIWKIGGSCLLDEHSYARAATLVASSPMPRLIVVSAMRGVTDQLERLLLGEPETVEQIIGRHRQVWESLDGDSGRFAAFEAELRTSLSVDLTKPALRRDRVLSWGDEVSASILQQALQIPSIKSVYVDAGKLGLVTNESHGNAQPVGDVHKKIAAGLAAQPGLIITPGFVGLSDAGQRTTLGRNSSDYTAALIAAASSASALRIFSSASGILSADPALVPEAHHLQELSYDEAAEIVHAGSPVLHPMALATMKKARTMAYLESLEEGCEAVTLILNEPSSRRHPFRAIPHRSGLALIEIHPHPGIEGPHLLSECLDILRASGVHIDLSSASESNVHLAVCKTSNLADLMSALESKAEVKISEGFSSVSLVGRGVTETKGIASRALGLLAQGQVFPRLMNDGGTAPCISFLVEDQTLTEALNLLHRGLISAPR